MLSAFLLLLIFTALTSMLVIKGAGHKSRKSLVPWLISIGPVCLYGSVLVVLDCVVYGMTLGNAVELSVWIVFAAVEVSLELAGWMVFAAVEVSLELAVWIVFAAVDVSLELAVWIVFAAVDVSLELAVGSFFVAVLCFRRVYRYYRHLAHEPHATADGQSLSAVFAISGGGSGFLAVTLFPPTYEEVTLEGMPQYTVTSDGRVVPGDTKPPEYTP
ncbi:hypothetical protein LSAT2_032189 [Lamellibrachia satsuma]|nr:hypothetical protein LSAT2_032189 [Lamellibrachia satsuma]